MLSFSALSRLASFNQIPVTNALALLLRFANIFFATTAPLFFHQNAALLKSTPLLGLASMGVLGVVLFLPGHAPRVLGLVWAADLACGVMLLNVFGLGHPARSWVFFLFAAVLGMGMAGTEVRAMELAVQPSDHRRLRKRISRFSFAKSLGLGSGFLAGGAVAGSPRAAEPARILVGIAAAAIIVLSLALCLGKPEGQEPEWDRGGAPSQPVAAFGTLGLIVLVFIVINIPTP